MSKELFLSDSIVVVILMVGFDLQELLFYSSLIDTDQMCRDNIVTYSYHPLGLLYLAPSAECLHVPVC